MEGTAEALPHRYQGQYHDVETGLYYNRFRYYDCDTGNYISQDPIGLLGNNPNFYAYVPDTNSWVDVFGLNCSKNKRIAKELSEPEVLERLQKKYPIDDGFEILSEPRVYINNTLNFKGNKAYAKPDLW
ncbi:MAG: RHS repeat-associated core domain-containing protein [Bacteroidales bacterium]